MPEIPRLYRPDQAVLLADGREIPADNPKTASRSKPEHWLRDQLAFKVRGLVEARLPFGRADIMTPQRIFEVEHFRSSGTGAVQAFGYARQTQQQPVLALFGAASHHRMRDVYQRCQDTGLVLWWHLDGDWHKISNGHQIRAADEPDHEEVKRRVQIFISSPQGACWVPWGFPRPRPQRKPPVPPEFQRPLVFDDEGRPTHVVIDADGRVF